MRTHTPRTALQAVTRRRFLLTGWPWRALAYVVTTPPVMLLTGIPLAGLVAPWIVLVAQIREGISPRSLGILLFLGVLGAVLLAAVGPLLAMPVAALERRRLRLVDSRPVTSPHRRPRGVGPWPWLRTRYSEAATWRELGYVCLLASVVAATYLLSLTPLLMGPIMIASPLLVGDGAVSLGFVQITTVPQARGYAVAGVALLPTIPYLLALLTGAHGALARALLHGADADGLRAQLVEVSRSRARLVDAFESERRRIERDLHDGAQSRLTGLTLKLGVARLDLTDGSPAAQSVTEAHEQAKQLMAELRQLIRGIHPRVLTDRGLPAALQELADDSPVPVTVGADLAERPSRHVEGTAYFAVVEALNNVAKHSGAGEATVTARRERDREGDQEGELLVVEVRDDGHGGADPAGGGLTGLADRVAVIDGRMLLSSPPGGPTVLRVELPWSSRQSQPPSSQHQEPPSSNQPSG